MTAVTITRASVTGLRPCEEGMDVARAVLPARRRLTLAQAREAGTSFLDLVWVAAAMARTDQDVDRCLRLWMADCATRVLDVYEKTEITDALRSAIVAARRYARGEIDKDAWAAARAAGRSAAKDSARAALLIGCRESHWAATWVTAWANAANSLWGANWVVANDAAFDSAEAEKVWQFDRFILWFSDEEPDDWPLPASGFQAVR